MNTKHRQHCDETYSGGEGLLDPRLKQENPCHLSKTNAKQDGAYQVLLRYHFDQQLINSSWKILAKRPPAELETLSL